MNKIHFIAASLLISSLTNADLNLELPDLNLPDLGGQTSFIFNSASERDHGLTILRKLRNSGKLIEDPEINTWIRSLGNRLTSYAPRTATPYYFIISRDSSVNAFATLGGVVVINAGLILLTDSESELAAVIAHEIAHVTQRHVFRMIEKAKANKMASSAALLAGILAASKDSQAGQAIVNTAIATMAHNQLAFSREAESEADRVGIRILTNAGFNPKGMPTFLTKLEQYEDSQNTDIQEYLQGHPLTLKRVSDTNSRAKNLTYRKGKKESSSYLYMREKIRALSNTTRPTPNQTPSKIKKYAKALLLAKRKNYSSALQIMGSRSRVISEAIIIADLLNKQRRYNETISMLAPLLNIYIGNEALSILLSQAYISIGQSEKAWQTINEVIISEQTSLEFFEKKQEVARMTRRDSEAYQSAAERSIRMGNYKSAISLLRRAIKLRRSNPNELQQMQYLLDRMIIRSRKSRPQ